MKLRSTTIDAAVLHVLGDGDWHYSLDLMRAAGLGPFRFWPSLDRLEDSGLIEATWEAGVPPRRRLYRLVQS